MKTKSSKMKQQLVLFFLCLFITSFAQAQDRGLYRQLVGEAWSLYETEDYLKSAKKYSEAFVALNNKGMTTDRYNAACSWALASFPDSAFVQLFKIAQKGNYTNYKHISTDSDLNTLHEDQRWGEVLQLVKANKEKAEANLDKGLVDILANIYEEDQKYRKQIGEIEEKYGWESKEMKAHWDLIAEKDSVNLIAIKKILDERGWLGPDIIGNRGNSTLFLVIQHSDIEIQEKYLPMMREAVAKGNARASSLALLEDRVALRKGARQIYGSQVARDKETGAYYVLPLDDPDNVDKRRAEVGLDPLQSYISRWGITWDAEAYKKQLPILEAKRKKE